jgi:hypothetical protein
MNDHVEVTGHGKPRAGAVVVCVNLTQHLMFRDTCNTVKSPTVAIKTGRISSLFPVPHRN